MKNKQILLLIIILFVLVFLYRRILSTETPNETPILNNLKRIELITNNEILIENYKLIFLINFRDFNCALCLNDFIAITDSLNKYKCNKNSVIYLIEKDDRPLELQKNLLERWRKSNYIISEVFLVENYKKYFKDQKSAVLLKTSKGYSIYSFPFTFNTDELYNEIRNRD